MKQEEEKQSNKLSPWTKVKKKVLK